MHLRLFYSPGSCSLSAHIQLREVGVDFALEKVDLKAGEQNSATFLRLNPSGRVPVVVKGDVVVTELSAISWYISAQAPERSLYPAHPLAMTRVMEWMSWLSGEVHGYGFAAYWRPERFITDEAHHPALKARGRSRIEESFSRIERSLVGPWAIGEAFTPVDPYLFVLYRWGTRIQLPMRSRHPRWHAHTQAMLARPSVQAAMVAEGIELDIDV